MRACVRIATWIDSMISIDRMICVVFPLKYKLIASKQNVIRIVTTLIFLQLIINSPNLFYVITYEAEWNPLINQTQLVRLCTTTSSSLSFARDLLDEVVRSVVPLIVQVSSSMTIIYTLKRSRNHSNPSQTKLKDRDRRFAVTICVLDLFFCVTQVPELISTIYLFATGASKSSIVTNEKQAIAFYFYKTTMGIASFNYILVFFVNFITNRIYRRESIDLFNDMFKFKK
jgi:hypothetical protein